MLKTDVPALVSELRRRTGLTQEKLAARLGVSFPTVNRWEKGRAMPSGLALQALERFIQGLGPGQGDLLERLLGHPQTVQPSDLAAGVREVPPGTAAAARHGGAPSEEMLREIVRRIVAAVHPEKIILFGSAARGEMGPDSDLDLLVVKQCEHRREMAWTIQRQLVGAAVGIPKDILVFTPDDIARLKDTPGLIVRTALEEGRVLYAA